MLDHYLELVTDPAHTLVEFTYVLLDVLIIDAVRRRWRKHLKREHLIIDAEHGVTHAPQGTDSGGEYATAPSSEEQQRQLEAVRRKRAKRAAAFPRWGHSLEREADERWLAQTLGGKEVR